MSLKRCITGKAKRGKTDADRAKFASDLFDHHRARYDGRMSDADADAAAGAAVIRILGEQLVRRTENAARTRRIADDIVRFGEGYRTAQGEPRLGRALLAVLNRDIKDQTGRTNVWSRSEAILRQAHAHLGVLVEKYRPHIGGFTRNVMSQRNLIRELSMETTGDAVAAAAARAYRETDNLLVDRFNAAGGNIQRRSVLGGLQTHDMLRVMEKPRDEWVDYVLPRLNPAHMIDDSTGLPMSAVTLRRFVEGAYDEISTGGWATREPVFAMGQQTLANTRQFARELHFLNADAWMEYQKKFGAASIYDATTKHIHDMAMDIALLEVLGPNPRAMVFYMAQLIEKDAAGKGAKLVERARKDIYALHRDFDELTGKTAVPVHVTLANAMSATRNMLTSALLGSATIMALTDIVTQGMAAKFNGLSAVRVWVNVLKGLSPHVAEHQRIAVRMGLGADAWTTMAMAQVRYAGEVIGPRWSKMFSDGTLRLSGLSPLTAAGRHGVGMTFIAHLGEFVGRPFTELPEATQRQLKFYGIDERQWARIPTEALFEYRNTGVMLLSTPDLMDFDQELGSKVAQMILTASEFGVPTTTPRARSQMHGGTRPGTIWGELSRSTIMFLSYPVNITHLHIMRGLNLPSLSQRGRYLASLIVGTTIMGALGYQLSQLSIGKNMEDMNTVAFWGKALARGGGLGLFGDFLLRDPNAFGGRLVELGGPAGGLVLDAWSLTVGNLYQLGQGKDTNFGKEAIRFAARYYPGSSLWYSRLAMQRLVFDQLEYLADPHASTNFRRSEQATMNRTGQSFWWGKGDLAPEGLPNFRVGFNE
tara:strand:- start:4433 stop:6886 length:2454 start_codon:yes stop_codon:yes gene_type:complete